MSDRHYHRPRTTYEMKAWVMSKAEEISGEEPRGFHAALEVIRAEMENEHE